MNGQRETPIDTLLRKTAGATPLDLPPSSLYPNAISTEGAKEGDVLKVVNGVATWVTP